jgi:hypothetical protein
MDDLAITKEKPLKASQEFVFLADLKHETSGALTFFRRVKEQLASLKTLEKKRRRPNRRFR